MFVDAGGAGAGALLEKETSEAVCVNVVFDAVVVI
jgi:hypothetical protein